MGTPILVEPLLIERYLSQFRLNDQPPRDFCLRGIGGRRGSFPLT